MRHSRTARVSAFIVTVVIACLFALPIVWMISSSLKDNNTLFKVGVHLIPDRFIWQNYVSAVTYIPFFQYLKNTFTVSALSTIGIVLSTPSVAYAFAKMKWPGRNVCFLIVLSTMMLPFQVQIIPLYVLFKNMGWLGTLLPLIVPNFFGAALYVFLLRQFMIGIPNEVIEAAFIDGAGHFKILTRIVVPFCLPAIFAIGLFTFMASWTDFFGPLVFLTNPENYTLSLGLQQYSSLHHTEWAYLMAACTLFTLPVLIAFFFTQRSFILGISFKGVKG
jgi:multiple sugar transport system permease protein